MRARTAKVNSTWRGPVLYTVDIVSYIEGLLGWAMTKVFGCLLAR